MGIAALPPLNGKPINEPIAVHGPCVMNTEAEAVEAIADLNGGKWRLRKAASLAKSAHTCR